MKLLAFASCLLAALPFVANRASAQTANFSVIHTFGPSTGGSSPNGRLTLGPDGSFYGAAGGDGATVKGTIFRLAPTGEVTTLHSFTGPDGEGPNGALLLEADGTLYGTTYQGGSAGYGTIFALSPAGVLTTLHAFTDADGHYPESSVIRGRDGNLYGTTPSGGGQPYNGTVYQLTPGGVFTTLHTFPNHDNTNPTAPLVQGADGSFYGTTYGDGMYRDGTVYSITSAGVFTVLHDFTGRGDGANPHGGLLLGSNGLFYGTTVGGGYSHDGIGQGTIFQMTPAGQVTMLYTFDSRTLPQGGLYGPFIASPLFQTSDGTLYGMAEHAGANGVGQVFSLSPTGSFFVLRDFDGGDQNYVNGGGTYPSGGLVQGNDGAFYGTAALGGSTGGGVAYRIAVTPGFFANETYVANEVFYLQLPNGKPFGYYSYLDELNYIYHFDLGYEYVFNAADNQGGVYLYDFASQGFFYTSPQFSFPYLYDFSLNSVVYYYPDPANPGRYNTNGTRYFYVFNTGKIISK